MDRLTEFVSKSFDGQHKEENLENNNSKKTYSSVDMSKETLDKEELARASQDYDDIDVTGDRELASEDTLMDPDVSLTSPAGPAAVTRVTPRSVPIGICPAETLLQRRASFMGHKESALVTGFAQRHSFGIDSLSAKLQETAAAQQDRASSPSSSSSPSITIPSAVSTSVSTSVARSMCNGTAGLSLSYTNPLISPSCNKVGQLTCSFIQICIYIFGPIAWFKAYKIVSCLSLVQ